MRHFVLETDSPYLAPVPYRGKRNESSYILNIAEYLADLKGISLEEVAKQTTENSKILFKI
jgi:TatD DNase family protein